MKKFITLLLSLSTLLLCLNFSLQAKSFEGTININTASASELMQLPGIGKVKANNIIEMRKEKAFSSLEDLKRVKGIGEKRLESLKPYVAFSSASGSTKSSSTKPKTVSTQN